MTHAWLVAILDRFPEKGVEVLGRLALSRGGMTRKLAFGKSPPKR